MTAFISFSKRFGFERADYPALYQWSIAQPEAFWSAIWDFGNIISIRRGDAVLVERNRMPGAQWFPDAQLNFAQNLLRFRDDHPALLFANEQGARRSITYRELYRSVSAIASSLKKLGVVPGDRVVGYLPNIPETVIAMLAATSLGAIWSSCSPDFGLQAVLDRFGQIRPKILFTVDGYLYNGKPIDCCTTLETIVTKLPSLEKTILIPYRGTGATSNPQTIFWESISSPANDWVELEFAPLPFNHPLYLLYSSGTTGVPKCIVHGAGGTLLQHLKELILHTDLTRGDRIFYFTTCGWMMWNWLISSLATGATVVLYDGSPTYPETDSLWRIAEELQISVFGTSAKYLASIEKAGVKPGSSYRLAALKTILSTGSPLLPESFDYVYRHIQSDLCLSSISGGTDILSCFALGNPLLPVYRGELQCRGLGMDVAILNESGESIRDEKGELCCLNPFPSMPVYLWNDPTGERYRSTYFSRFPNIWCHGDWAELTHHDGMIIYGRSDATLNPGGVRIGTAEIYRVVESVPGIIESIAVGQAWEGDSRMILFVVLRNGRTLTDELRSQIKTRLRQEASPRHVPAKIIAIPEIPRTISGKIVELAVQQIIHGREVKNRDALANPQALDYFRDLPELHED